MQYIKLSKHDETLEQTKHETKQQASKYSTES
jgi:hypothetical protein